MEELMQRGAIIVCLLGACICLAISAIAQERQNSLPPAPVSATHSSAIPSHPSGGEEAAAESALRIEGEKRFRTNCGRCHMAPHKFPPSVMATAIRHMRVRATLTDEDMRLILHYMTQ
jgi:mono/diheme cytochrome c family protein